MRGNHYHVFESERAVRDNNHTHVAEESLSGTCVRNLVKQLTSLGVKDSMNKNKQPCSSFGHHQSLGESPQPHKPSQRKKQVRRRLLTTRVCEEDLLNTAERRREVLTALRLHRASMEQNSNNNPQLPDQTLSESSFDATPQPQHKEKAKSRKNSKIYDSSTPLNLSNNLDNLTYQSFQYQPPQTSYSWPPCDFAPHPIPETFNLLLPNQTLGLNLNIQDFNDLYTTPSQNNYSPALCYSSTSSSTSNSPHLSVAKEDTPYMGLSQAPLMEDLGGEIDLGLHHAVDDEEMAVIRSVGEQLQIEWDDTINMVTSAWWFNFLNTMENDTNSMEFPPWLNTNDNCVQQLDDQQTPALPQMDIGETEGMDRMRRKKD